MALVDGYSLRHDGGAEPQDIRAIYELAKRHNQFASDKISIYKSFQDLSFYFGSTDTLSIKLRGQDLDAEARRRIITSQYLVLESQLFFFSEDTAESLKILERIASRMEVVSLLRKIPPERRPSDEELQSFLTSEIEAQDSYESIELTIDLYPYQQEGLQWLSGRYSSGVGGILADDMGLGKTAQVIALTAEKLSNRQLQRALIVVPNSLIANWLNEFSKFTKGIRPYIHWGPDRVGFPQQLAEETIIVTTYSTVVNDLALFKEFFFDLLILDEASLLKNPESRRTMSVAELPYGCAIAITGTPFENSMMDLWSLTDLVSTNFLGDRDVFRRNYVNQGVNELTSDQIKHVEEQIRPILLRRMKTDVLKQLPPKLDIYKHLSMGEIERETYASIERDIKANRDDKTRAFALISHLRKFSAHPLLSLESLDSASFDEMTRASSKFSFLASALEKIARADEKALVFANHIALLDKFVDCFTSELEIRCWKVDGSVPSSERQAVVDQFTKVDGAAILFLNPITAGMGLNITAANHVFHYSRQWNPALEEQATARAYRNGQLKSVNVYYLFYADSIEQTIHERIMTKTEIADGVIKRTQIGESEEELILALI